MKKSRAFREGAAILLTVLVIVCIFATGMLDRQRVWKEMTYHSILAFDKPHPNGIDRVTYSLEQGDNYGVHNWGPGYNLPAGKYRIKFRMEADGENYIRFSSKNNALFEPEKIKTNPDQWEQEAWFEIKEDAIKTDILFEFASGSRMRVDDLRLYSPFYKDDAYTVSLLLIACCLLSILYGRGKIASRDLGSMALIGFAVLVAGAPAYKENMILSFDSEFHMARIMNLADGLSHMQFPVRLGGFTFNGYGALTSVFYPDLLLIPFALLVLGGATITYAVNAMCIAANIVAAASMYACARRIFDSKETGVCASILYVLSTYRLADIYSRAAFGEMWAMSLLPMFVLGMWEVICGDTDRWPMLAVSAALIYLTHLLTTLLCAAGAVCVCLLCAKRIIRERRLKYLIGAAVVALLMGLYTMVPFLMYSAQGLGAQEIRLLCADYALSPAQLFMWGAGVMPVGPKDEQLSYQALEIGVPMMIGAVALIYMRAVSPAKDKKEKHALFFLFVGVASAWMTTTLFPWRYLSVLTFGYSDYLQFPWRLLLVTSVMLSLAGGYAYMQLADQKKDWMTFAVLTLSLVMVLPTITVETRSDAYTMFGEGASPHITNREYTIPGSDILSKTLDREAHIQGNMELKNYVKDSTTITAQVNAVTDSTLSVPLFGYDGYKATIDGEEVPWSLGDNNRIQVLVPAGMQGELRIWYEGKAIWRVADVISLISVLALGAYCLTKRGALRANGGKAC